jgi:hypothetical protein
MFLRAGYYGRAAAPPADAVPDGPAALDPSEWPLPIAVTRTVGPATLNPPIVTLTEDNTTSDHGVSMYGNTTVYGPKANFKFYLRAGTRRYLSICALLSSPGAIINIDTVSWTIANSFPASATIDSMTLTNLGNGDYLLDVTVTCPAAAASLSFVSGAPDDVAAYRPSYTGNGSTILVRRVDVSTVP